MSLTPDAAAMGCLVLGTALLVLAVILAAAFWAHARLAASAQPQRCRNVWIAVAVLLAPVWLSPWLLLPLVIGIAISGAVLRLACWVLCKIVAGPILTYRQAVAVAAVAFPAKAGISVLAFALCAFVQYVSRRELAGGLPQAVTVLGVLAVLGVFMGGYMLTSGVTALMLRTTWRTAASVIAFYYVLVLVLVSVPALVTWIVSLRAPLPAFVATTAAEAIHSDLNKKRGR